MAQDFNTNVVINTNGEAEALETLNNLGSALNDVGGAAEGAEKSSESLRSQLRRLQAELADLDPNTEKFQELSRQTGEIKDRMNDAAEATRANAGPAFESLGNNFNLLTQRLGSLDFEGASQSLKGIAGNIKNVNFGEFAGGIKQMGSALGSVGKALLTNPIFLIGAAIAAAVVYADELLSLVDGVSSAEAERQEQLQANVKAQEDALSAISDQEEVLKLQGKSEKEILQMKIAQSQEAINAAVTALENQKLLKQQQIDAATRNRDILKGLLNFVSLPITAVLAGFDMLTQKAKDWGVISEETFGTIGNLRDKFTTSVSELIFDPAAAEKEGQALVDETDKTLKRLQNQQAGFRNQVAAMDKSAADKKKADSEKSAAERKKLEEDTAKEMADIMKQLEAENAKEAEDAKKRAEDLAKFKKNAAQQSADEIAAIEELAYEAGLSNEQKELRRLDEYYFEKIELAKQNGIDTTALEQEYANKTAEIDENYRKEKEAKDKEAAAKERAIQDAKVQIAADAVNVLIALNDSFSGKDEASRKRAFERNKKLQIAQALISTYQGAAAAYTAATLSPITVAFPGYPFVQAGIAVAAGLAQVNKIRQTQFEGGGGGGSASIPSTGASGGGGQAGTPQSPINTSFLQNRPEQNPLQTYVVEGQITDKQEAAQKVRDQSRL
jgi:hypothetical protein